MDRIINDVELGQLVVRENSRAKRLVFHTKSDAIYISAPVGITLREVKEAIEKLRSQLLATKKKLTRPLIDLNFRIEAEFFKLSVTSGTNDRFMAHSEPGKMQIICPPTADFTDEKLQEWLRKVIKEALRRNGKIFLHSRLNLLSEQYQLPYRDLKINASHGRWGSCSGTRMINLSCYLVLLPGHLIDYVLLHELCHTREMNHGEHFWQLLNQCTDGKAFALRAELSTHKTEIQ
ncbi:MAG: SprT family zinc-dependent metalloprotease [Bacteroides sp.]